MSNLMMVNKYVSRPRQLNSQVSPSETGNLIFQEKDIISIKIIIYIQRCVSKITQVCFLQTNGNLKIKFKLKYFVLIMTSLINSSKTSLIKFINPATKKYSVVMGS